MKKTRINIMLLLLVLFSVFLIMFYCLSLKNNSDSLSDETPQSTTDVLHDGRININTATAEQLCLIPEINNKIASNIVLYRWFKGPFKTTSDLINVDGVTQKLINRISPYITVGGEAL